MKKQYRELLHAITENSRSEMVGIFCNHTAFDYESGKYLPEILSSNVESLKVLIPEHGFFAEIQDQEPVVARQYFQDYGNIVYNSLYQDADNKLGDLSKTMKGIDTLLIDIQDVGVRYFTYLDTIIRLFNTISTGFPGIQVVIIDHPNPAGRSVEGTLLEEKYTSLIGLAGIPHRYGLTIGELCGYLYSTYEYKFDIKVIIADRPEYGNDSFFINPSPNIPTIKSTRVYTGQCLFEGTNLSEGRGTTRPFEIFGAPFLGSISHSDVNDWNKQHCEAVLRPVQFVPTFHKYKDELCHGFQLQVNSEAYHSLLYSMKLINWFNSEVADFDFLEGPYEFGSELSAIELLTGDARLLDYINGKETLNEIQSYLKMVEKGWIKTASDYLLYEKPLFTIN